MILHLHNSRGSGTSSFEFRISNFRGATRGGIILKTLVILALIAGQIREASPGDPSRVAPARPAMA